MNILVLGGTRFFGVPMVKKLIAGGHQVTLATRGLTPDTFGNRVERLRYDLFDSASVKSALGGTVWDAVIDKVTYASNELRAVMDAVSCRKLIHMSTCSLYELDHMEIREEEFDPLQGELIWNDRLEADYATNKKRTERVLFQYRGEGEQKQRISVRYPFVVGPHDYTNRLRFYVKHLLENEPMWIDDINAKTGFIEETEAGEFFAFLLGTEFEGAINGAAEGTASMKEILDYLSKKTGKKPVIKKEGEEAPYNGLVSHSYSTERARGLGYQFRPISEWMYSLLDSYLLELR